MALDSGTQAVSGTATAVVTTPDRGDPTERYEVVVQVAVGDTVTFGDSAITDGAAGVTVAASGIQTFVLGPGETLYGIAGGAHTVYYCVGAQ